MIALLRRHKKVAERDICFWVRNAQREIEQAWEKPEKWAFLSVHETLNVFPSGNAHTTYFHKKELSFFFIPALIEAIFDDAMLGKSSSVAFCNDCILNHRRRLQSDKFFCLDLHVILRA